jgi:branched-subunit amino acid transport protein AzlD
MTLSFAAAAAVVAVCAVCTFAERALPFWVFGNRPVPGIIRYLGRVLPPAVMMTLVVYVLRGVSLRSLGGFLPELIAVAVTAVLHFRRRNTLLSIVGGTACYMVLVQCIF